MEKELYDLIEAYLDGTLPDEKRLALEERMTVDEDFRQEVALHRELQEAYADPDRWQLKSALLAAMEEPLTTSVPSGQKPDAVSNPWKWWRLLPIVLLLGIGIWYLSKPPAVPPEQNNGNTTPTEQPTTPPEKDQEIKSAQENKLPDDKNKGSQPMAVGDPSAFQENRSMEGLIAMRGDGPITVTMNHPQINERFNPKSSSKTNVLFSGSVTGLPVNEPVQLMLLVFNNKDIKKPQWSQAIEWKGDVVGKALFEHPILLDIPKGLYYFRIEDQESGEIVAVGKFFIGNL